MFRRFKSNKGTTLILFAVGITVLLGFTAMVVDIGRVMVETDRFQDAIDATVLAAAQDLPDTSAAMETADNYIVMNGYQPSDITVSFSDSDKVINITGSKQIQYTLARILGFDSTTISPSASAESGSIGGAFNYALFSGSKTTTLTLNGSSQYIGGSSHTNKNFVANGSRITVTGACEAMTTIAVNGSHIDIDNRYPASPYVEMPDFAEEIKQQAESAGQTFRSSKTYSGSSLTVDQPIFVNGNLTVNGSKFRGKGCVLATGNITFNGSNLNESTSDAVCFYSMNGNIIINGSNAEFDGILYAPNGSITMNGSNQTVNGRVIGNSVTINGSNLRIESGSNELNSLPSRHIKLVR